MKVRLKCDTCGRFMLETSASVGPGGSVRCYSCECGATTEVDDPTEKTTAEQLVDLLCAVLSARAGELLTPQLITERARNAAQVLLSEFEMRKRSGS